MTLIHQAGGGGYSSDGTGGGYFGSASSTVYTIGASGTATRIYDLDNLFKRVEMLEDILRRQLQEQELREKNESLKQLWDEYQLMVALVSDEKLSPDLLE